MEFIDVSAKTIEDAIAKGVAQLAAEGQELVETKVLEQPSSGFLGAVETSESTVTEKPSKKELSKEDQQEIAEKGKQFLDDMFTQMGLTVVIEKMMTKDKITFQVHGEDLGILIGKHGQTLDAIQYLTNLVAHKDVSGHCHIVVDVENYRSRREETLVNLAKRLASKVKRNRQKVSLEPMNAFERKIIHTALQGDKNVVTNSEGDEPFRHVVISYKK
ncbi:MAG: RNA-binding cell elongation regulator Jag/EloR [Veillonella sp.]|nr:RNA-binding cell elongation regulator Jag/EloR [Veillonella sp.]